MGEDPYLVGMIGSAYVRGLESCGLVATLKHFVGYSASDAARNHAPVSMGPRTLRDVMLIPFEMAIREGGARSVMNSYSEIDGLPAAADPGLFTGVLRDEWGFEGTVVSDYWAIAFLQIMHRVAADSGRGRRAGPRGRDRRRAAARALLRASRSPTPCGRAACPRRWSTAPRGACCARRASSGCSTRTGPRSRPPWPAGELDIDPPEHRAIARELAEASIVLLANDGRPAARRGRAPRGARRAVRGRPARRSSAATRTPTTASWQGTPDMGLGIEVPTLLRRAGRASCPSARSPTSRAARSGARPLGHRRPRSMRPAPPTSASPWSATAPGCSGAAPRARAATPRTCRCPASRTSSSRRCSTTGTPVVLVVVSGRPYALGRYAAGPRRSSRRSSPARRAARALAGVLCGRVAPVGAAARAGPAQHGRAAQHVPASAARRPQRAGSATSTRRRSSRSVTASPTRASSTTDFALSAERSRRTARSRCPARCATRAIAPATEVVQLYLADPVAQVTRPVIQLVGFHRVALEPGERRARALPPARRPHRVHGPRSPPHRRAGRDPRDDRRLQRGHPRAGLRAADGRRARGRARPRAHHTGYGRIACRRWLSPRRSADPERRFVFHLSSATMRARFRCTRPRSRLSGSDDDNEEGGVAADMSVGSAQRLARLPDHVLYGVAYYAEYQPYDRLERDLDLMAEAGLTVIRVGESVWSTWEPEDGHFELDWLQPVLDGAHARGIHVILGTPTYAIPPWLVRKHPEVSGRAPHRAADPVRSPAGRRLLAARRSAGTPTRITRKVVGRYADHPAVIGYQVDNEPGIELFHNRGAFQAFVDGLRDALRRRGDAQRALGPRLLVAPHRPLGRAVAAGRQHGPLLRPRVAPLPVRAHDGLHRRAGRDRARARAPGPVRHDVHGALAPRVRPGRPQPRARHRRGQPVLRDAGGADDAGAAAGGRASRLAWNRAARPVGDPLRRPTSPAPRATRRSSSRRPTRCPSASRTRTSRPTTGSGARRRGRWWPAARAWSSTGTGTRSTSATRRTGSACSTTTASPAAATPRCSGSPASFERAGDAVVDLVPDADVGLLYSPREQVGDGVPPAARRRRPAPPIRGSYDRIVGRFYEGLFGAGVQADIVYRPALRRRREALRCAGRCPRPLHRRRRAARPARRLRARGRASRAGLPQRLRRRRGAPAHGGHARPAARGGRRDLRRVHEPRRRPCRCAPTPARPARGRPPPRGPTRSCPKSAETLVRLRAPAPRPLAGGHHARARRGRVTYVGTLPDRALAVALARWLRPAPDAWADRPQTSP